MGGAPELVVPDNPKVAVIKACFYEPVVNRTYGDMIEHCQTAVLPARPRKTRDKAKVEVAVRIMERHLLGRLRKQTFYSLADLNTARPSGTQSRSTKANGVMQRAFVRRPFWHAWRL